VVTLLRQTAKKFNHLPIAMVLDNALHQRTLYVAEQAQKLGHHLVFLPICSPHLLLERLWK
jgi:transposase